MEKINRINTDLNNERSNSNIDVEEMKKFLGVVLYGSKENHSYLMETRHKLVKAIKPIYYENFYNLSRDEKYEMMLKKSLETLEFIEDHKINHENGFFKLGIIGGVFGIEKFLFSLHISAFLVSIEMWGTPEQNAYWKKIMQENGGFGTYIQTELGHGTYVRGLETTATYDKNTQEFVINSPTLSSIKYWPGIAGITCNHGLVMAKLIIDGKEHGIHAFVIQLRSLNDHSIVPGVELGDIGKKAGFESQDNGYVKFTNLRIPRFNMLMRNAVVYVDGKFERVGSELAMYACMLMLRAMLCMFSPLLLSISTTIAIRYSAVRRQTSNLEGKESQIIDYQTQQYRLFPSLATTYAFLFTASYFNKMIFSFKATSKNFTEINTSELAKFHAVSAGLKAVSFNNCLKFSQLNRLCCGGHGYSASSGLPQIIQEADGGCTYEGDNVVLLMQTARYLLKCAQKNVSPHLDPQNFDQLKHSSLFKYFEEYFKIYERLYENEINQVSDKMLKLVTDQNLDQLEAWNQSSVQLIHAAKCYISFFVIKCNFAVVLQNENSKNQDALKDLFELYLLYEICDTFSSSLLKFNILDTNKLNEFSEKLYSVLSKVRKNAVSLVDSFDYLDSNLCSSLGAYDGNVYENLYEFARSSKLNQKEVHDSYHKYLKPYVLRKKNISKL